MTTEEKHPDDVFRDLPVKLSEADLAVKADELAQAELEVDDIKSKVRELNAKKRAAEGHRLKLAQIVDTGEEDRQVKCRWIEDLPQNRKLLVRQDNQETVEEVALTADDLQGTLPGQDGDSDDSDGLHS